MTELPHSSRVEIIQTAVMAAIGCTVIDFRNIRRLDEAVNQIARFVEASLCKAEEAERLGDSHG